MTRARTPEEIRELAARVCELHADQHENGTHTDLSGRQKKARVLRLAAAAIRSIPLEAPEETPTLASTLKELNKRHDLSLKEIMQAIAERLDNEDR